MEYRDHGYFVGAHKIHCSERHDAISKALTEIQDLPKKEREFAFASYLQAENTRHINFVRGSSHFRVWNREGFVVDYWATTGSSKYMGSDSQVRFKSEEQRHRYAGNVSWAITPPLQED